MTVYLDIVMVLNFLIDGLLLIGTERLCGFPVRWKRIILAASFGGLYGGICLLPSLSFMGNLIWRLLSLFAMSVIAFGFNIAMIKKSILFTVLSMALGGVAIGIGFGGVHAVIGAASLLCLLCSLMVSGSVGTRKYVPVKLSHGKSVVNMIALLDTGNTLKDPVSGSNVLVVSAEIAERLTGLTQQQLRSPLETLSSANIVGLKLIPYHSVGKKSGFMLAMRYKEVCIGNWKGSTTVAFSPDRIGNGGYEALTGGAYL